MNAFSSYVFYQQTIDLYLALLAASADPLDPDTQEECARRAGLVWGSLLESDKEYIQQQIENF